MSSDGSRTTNSSRFSQFGLYRTIDARTEEFLRLSRKRQIRQGCACAAVSTAITVTVVVTILLVYEYTVNIDANRNQKSKKPYWHEIVNDSSTFEATKEINKASLDATSLKLLPIILKTLNNNLIKDNEMDDASPTPVPDKADTSEVGYSSNYRNTFTSWLRTPNTFDYRPHYKSPTNLDYYSKIRKIQNYQKVFSLFDKMLNSKMTVTSSEVIVEELTDKPKETKKAEEEVTSTVRPYTSRPRRIIMVRKVIQPTTMTTATTKTKPAQTTISSEPEMKAKRNSQCSCPQKLGLLLGKLIQSIQDVLPELTMMVKMPCNGTKDTLDEPTSTTPVVITRSDSESEDSFVQTDNAEETQPVTLPTFETLTTETPIKFTKSYKVISKAKKRLHFETNNNKLVGIPMRKLNIKPATKKKINVEKRKHFHEINTEGRTNSLDATEVVAKSKYVTVPMTVSPSTSTATSLSTTKKTTPKTTTTIKTTTETDMLSEDYDDTLIFPTAHYNVKRPNSSTTLELTDFHPHVFELIKSSMIRSKTKKKEAAKEPNTYLDQILENSSLQKEQNIQPESMKPDIEKQTESKLIHANELTLDSKSKNIRLEKNNHKSKNINDRLNSISSTTIRTQPTSNFIEKNNSNSQITGNKSNEIQKTISEINSEITTAKTTDDKTDKIALKGNICTGFQGNEKCNEETLDNNVQDLLLNEHSTFRKAGNLKGQESIKKTSQNDRKGSLLSNPKSEIRNDTTQYTDWLENVGHSVNDKASWWSTVASSTIRPKNKRYERPWYITRYESFSEKNNTKVPITHDVVTKTEPRQPTTWSYDLFNEDNQTKLNCSEREDVRTDIEMPDGENLMPVQEVPLSTYLGSSLLPQKLQVRREKLPDENLNFVDNTPSFLKSMLPHNRPIYLEIARRDWKKDVSEYETSREQFSDVS